MTLEIDLAQDEEPALEGVARLGRRAAADEDLAVDRLARLDLRALATGEELSVGTVRQPSSVWPSSATTRSTISS